MHFTFLDHTFEALELRHRAELQPFLVGHPHGLSGYTFGSLVAWDPTWRFGWTFCDPESLLVSFRLGQDARHLMQPIGTFSPEAQRAVLEAARALPYPLRIVWVERPFLDAHADFVAHFDVTEERANANYVYDVNDLADLPGRRYSSKRNFISQAGRLYSWDVAALRESNLDGARHVLGEIRREQEMELTGSLKEELVALQTTLGLFDELDQDGVLVSVAGEPAAFAIFERQSPDTAVIHFERALRRHKGMHQVVNQAAAQAIRERGFAFVNREEDMGSEGLRKAKESYHPHHLVDAFELTFRS